MSLTGPLPLQRSNNELPASVDQPESMPASAGEPSGVTLRVGSSYIAYRTSLRTDPFDPISTTIGKPDLFPSFVARSRCRR
jgi:hypothetical protein